MDKKIFLKYMKKISIAFPSFALETETLGIYYEYLGSYSEEQLNYAVDNCISTCKFMPTISQLKGAIEELKPNDDEKSREFESKLFSCSTDTLLTHFKKTGDEIAVKIINRNYDIMRNAMLSDVKIIKSQMREQYRNAYTLKDKEQTIKQYGGEHMLDNNGGIKALADKMKGE